MKAAWIAWIGLTLVATCAGPGVAQPLGTQPLRIGAVVDGPWERNAELYQVLDGALREVLGTQVDVRIIERRMLEGDWTLAGIQRLNDRLLADPGVDLLVALGVIASHDLATRGPLPKPVIAGLVIDPARQKIPFARGVSGVKNLSYLVFPSTFKRDIALFQGIVPFKHLVLVSSKRYDQVLPSAPAGVEEMVKAMGIALTEVSVDSAAAELLDVLPPDAEAVYLEPTLHMSPFEFSKMVQGFADRRLPSFSLMGESDVRQGIMAGANPDVIPRLARRIALHVQRILSGQDPSALSVEFPAGKRLFFNFRTAYRVGITPSWDILLESEVVQIDTSSAFGTHITLTGALQMILDENLDVRAATRAVRASAENVTIARSNLLPHVDLVVNGYQIDKDRAAAAYQPDRSAVAEVAGSQVLLSEPAMANLSIQSSMQDAKEQELELTRLNALVSGGTAYLNFLRMRRVFGILMDNLKVTRSNLELAETRQNTGVAGPEEKLRWEVEIANVKKAVMVVHSQMNQARYLLNQTLNMPVSQETEPADVSLDDSAYAIANGKIRQYLGNPIALDVLNEYLVKEGISRSRELQQLDALIDAQERALTSSRLSYVLPSISLYGRVGQNFYKSSEPVPFSVGTAPVPPAGLDPNVPLYLGQLMSGISPTVPNRQDWTVGVQMSLNIFNGFGSRGATTMAGETLEQLRTQREAAAQRVELRIRAAMQGAKAAYFAIEQSRAEQEAAQKALTIVTEAYVRGAVSMLSVLDAQNSALRANQVATNALYDFFIQYLEVQRSLGRFDLLMEPAEREEEVKGIVEFVESVLKR
jgi:outer membrane protein